MGLGGLLAKADLDALKSEGLRRTVVGAVAILALIPGWFVFEPAAIFWAILTLTGVLLGIPIVSSVQDTVNKVKEKK